MNAHISWIFLIVKDKVLTEQKDIQDLKIIGLIKGKGKGIYTEKAILNFSSYVLSDNDWRLLSMGLNFSLPNKKVEFPRNNFVLLSYFTVTLVILAKTAVIQNFSKVS